jgi:4,5-DOPA dioxygenase extradiol
MNPVISPVFVSHGAPTLVLEDCPTREFLRQLGKDIGRPKGIVCISAHWTTAEPRVTVHPQPPIIHDFYGFPEELYSLSYPAPGDPVLAKRVLSLLHGQGVAAGEDMTRGFDHGAWVPLMLMSPDADIPVIQLSVQPHLGPEHHLAVGQALQPLVDEGVLLLASGSATHNLRDFSGRELNAEPLPYAREFSEWLTKSIIGGRSNEVLDYLKCAPQALRNHPTPEHFLPLFVTMGAGGEGQLLHDAYTYGVLSMAAYAW